MGDMDMGVQSADGMRSDVEMKALIDARGANFDRLAQNDDRSPRGRNLDFYDSKGSDIQQRPPSLLTPLSPGKPQRSTP